jgi:hypothetical protein
MRNVGRLKIGYYPLPETEEMKLHSLLSVTAPASVVDPCAGQGTALRVVMEALDVGFCMGRPGRSSSPPPSPASSAR